MKRRNKTKSWARPKSKKELARPISEFELQGGKITRGSFSGPHFPSLWIWSDPPDPDEHFAPFYRRAVSGDLSAFVDFYRAHGLSPRGAFYQCVGYLAAHGSAEETKIVQKIININLRGGPRTSSSAKQVLVREWEKRILPPAQFAAAWISQQRKVNPKESNRPVSREAMWQRYMDQNLNPASPGIRQHIDSASSWEVGSQPSYRISHSGNPSGNKPRAIELTTNERKAAQRSVLNYITSIALARGIVPKELFFDLARTTPKSPPPSAAVRRFARKLVY
jgi:hypothetical protein